MSRKLTLKRGSPSTVIRTQPCLLELLRLIMRDNSVAELSSGRSRGERGACRMSSRHSQRSRRGCFVSAGTICSSRKARRPDAGTKTDEVVNVEGLSTAYLDLISKQDNRINILNMEEIRSQFKSRAKLLDSAIRRKFEASVKSPL